MIGVDWAVVAAYCLLMLGIGIWFTRQASRSPEDFFVGGRRMPWWLIGLSDVASYGAASAPWVMLFFLGGFREFWLVAWVTWCVWMPLVAVIWAKMWRRLGVVTTAEFIERRYSGRTASAYRAVYAVYAYAAWAVLLLANIAVWFTQSISPILGWSPGKVLVIFGGITIIYTLLSGFFGVVYTELIQFFLIMAGAFVFMFIAVSRAGGLQETYARVETARGSGFLNPWPGFPLGGLVTFLALFVQGLFFAGSPFAGEGWTAQRAMSAHDENHAVLGQMLNCVLSLVVRVIPAVLIGMAVVALYPKNNVDVPAALWARSVRDLAPHGLLGLLLAGALGAFMAGISSTINWGSSYLLNDVYRRYLRPSASSREYILVSRILTVLTLVAAYLLGLCIDPRQLEAWVLFTNSALVVFSLPLAWLKWFWWRMNVFGEAVGTLGSFPLAYLVWFGSDSALPASMRAWIHATFGWKTDGLVPAFGDTARYPFWYGFAILFLSGWLVILAVTLMTRPEPADVLRRFYISVRPLGFWGPVARHADIEIRRSVRREARRDLVACVWGVLFCFAIVNAFFNLCARNVATGFAVAAVAAFCGRQFRRTALASQATEVPGTVCDTLR
jgi:Na+/proline symporter